MYKVKRFSVYQKEFAGFNTAYKKAKQAQKNGIHDIVFKEYKQAGRLLDKQNLTNRTVDQLDNIMRESMTNPMSKSRKELVDKAMKNRMKKIGKL